MQVTMKDTYYEASLQQDEVIRRWPHVVAALIAQSNGYFTPRSAANAIISFKLNLPFFCEWYTFTGTGVSYDEEYVKKRGADTLRSAIRNRHWNKRDLKRALAVVRKYNEANKSPLFASWM